MNHRTLALSLVALAAATSAAHATPSANGRYVNTDGLNGRYVNTGSLNGRYVNGTAANGRYVNGRYVNGPMLGGVALEWAYVEGTKIVAWKPRFVDEDGDGHYDDADGDGQLDVVYDFIDNFVGAELTANVVDNLGRDAGSETLRIDAQSGGTDRNTDVTYYNVSYKSVFRWYWYSFESWQPMCPGDNKAMAVQGTWDYRQGVAGAGGKVSDADITLACSNGAIGKCIDQLGYKPWYWQHRSVEGWYWDWWTYAWQYGPHDEWYSLSAAHEACVRMVRADYCGDGISHTEDGTGIDVGDALAQQVNPLGSPYWGFEATWNENGAMCLAAARFQQYTAQGGCACVDSWFEEDGTQHPYCSYDSFLPFAVDDCSFPADSLYNRSSTVPLPDSQYGGGW